MSQKEKLSIGEKQKFQKITPSDPEERRKLEEDLDLILSGLEYQQLIDEVGEEDVKTHLYLVDHPEAEKGLRFVQKVFSSDKR